MTLPIDARLRTTVLRALENERKRLLKMLDEPLTTKDKRDMINAEIRDIDRALEAVR
jgi:hypothetical protein